MEKSLVVIIYPGKVDENQLETVGGIVDKKSGVVITIS